MRVPQAQYRCNADDTSLDRSGKRFRVVGSQMHTSCLASVVHCFFGVNCLPSEFSNIRINPRLSASQLYVVDSGLGLTAEELQNESRLQTELRSGIIL
jgi:hypothetical protein